MKQSTLIFRRGPYEIFILILTMLSLVNGAILLFWPDENWSSVVFYIDLLISVIFFADFFSLLHRADDKRAYLVLGWGWADFLGSFPIPGFRLFRLFRVVAVSRHLHQEGIYGLKRGFRGKLSESTLLFVSLALIFLLEFGCILVLRAEDDATDSNIRTGGDAIWWAWVTVSTVGYGDRFPVTTSGRIIGALIMAMSVGLVAVFTAYVANSFFSKQQKEGDDDEMGDVLIEIAHLQRMVSNLQQSVDTLNEVSNRTGIDEPRIQ